MRPPCLFVSLGAEAGIGPIFLTKLTKDTSSVGLWRAPRHGGRRLATRACDSPKVTSRLEKRTKSTHRASTALP